MYMNIDVYVVGIITYKKIIMYIYLQNWLTMSI